MRSRKAIKYDPRCRELNKQYELNYNQELDNGVYNKYYDED